MLPDSDDEKYESAHDGEEAEDSELPYSLINFDAISLTFTVLIAHKLKAKACRMLTNDSHSTHDNTTYTCQPIYTDAV